jgi:hypothetical protein
MKISLRTPLAHAISLLSAILTGAGLMYLLDPSRGEERRSSTRRRLAGWLRALAGFAGTTIGAVQNTAKGAVVRMAEPATSREFSNRVLAERVRAELRRVVSHPGSIQVIARDGRVVLWGPVLADEPEKLHRHLGRMPGVRNLELLLTTREEAGGPAIMRPGSRRAS